MKFRNLTAILAVSLLVLTGCSSYDSSYFSPTTKDLPKSSKKYSKETVTRLARQNAQAILRHYKPTLSSDYFSRYLDMKSFGELKARVLEGMKITQETAKMTEKQAKLWNDIIKSKSYTTYTVNDADKKYAELEKIIQQMAANNKKSADEYIKQAYSMNHNEYTDFIKEQAKKFETSYNANSNAQDDEKTKQRKKHIEDSFSNSSNS